ncbi:bifunctional heptose 7-phosphate kinase/heptose 1-phosphate adenyltransferase [Sporocytophaga myxococcoides]|uniref:bifunctional heptose 7-phosphate kinase/heptose 1-phosphate adenyltransferase n=1 Tax=Sporocytophaga myxococcoides TaxID=153721 RepID=UPI0003FEF0F3|nr:bifunctional ADP-heptose synthase [Sporocytophaga myxococcoides]
MPGKTKITNIDSIDGLFKAFESLKVLIFGDVMIDSYLWGKVERISPEAPVPIINVQKKDQRLGGAANVALNVQSLGATPILCSVIGNDTEAKDFITLLEQNNLSTEGIIKSDSRITTIKHRVISGSYHMLRVDQEIDTPITKEETILLIEKAKKLIQEADVIIFEDYDKGTLHRDLIAEIVKLARDYNIPTVVDPKKRNFLHYKGVTLFKPNKKEMKEGLKLDGDLDNINELKSSIDILRSTLNADTILVTLSEKGVIITNSEVTHHIPAHLREIADVSGAGDTVVSAAALCCALNIPHKALAELSNLAGGIVCEHVGVVPIDKKMLIAEAKRLNVQVNNS